MRLPGGAVAEPCDVANDLADRIGPRHAEVFDDRHDHVIVVLFDFDIANDPPEAVEPAVKPCRHVVGVVLFHVLEHEVRYMQNDLLQFFLSEMVVVDHARESVDCGRFPGRVQPNLANCKHFRPKRISSHSIS